MSKTNQSVKVKEEDQSDVFSREEPQQHIGALSSTNPDRAAWEKRLKSFSALFNAGIATRIATQALDNPWLSAVDSFSVASLIEVAQASREQLTPSILAYKVHLADGCEELMRGLTFGDVSVRALREIVAAGDHYYVNNRLAMSGGGFISVAMMIMGGNFGAAAGGVPTSVIAPSVLFEQLELKRQTGPPQKPALLNHQYFDKR